MSNSFAVDQNKLSPLMIFPQARHNVPFVAPEAEIDANNRQEQDEQTRFYRRRNAMAHIFSLSQDAPSSTPRSSGFQPE